MRALATTATPAARLDPRHDDVVRPPVPGQAGDQHRGHGRPRDVRRAQAATRRASVRRAASRGRRADDQRLQQSALRVAADHSQRQEDREDDSEEERSEHRKAEDRRPANARRCRPAARCSRGSRTGSGSRARRGRGRRRSGAARPRRPCGAAPRAGRSRRSSGSSSRRLAADCLEVGLFERRGQDADAVDLAAGRDQLRDEPRRVLTRGAFEQARPVVGLDLHTA